VGRHVVELPWSEIAHALVGAERGIDVRQVDIHVRPSLSTESVDAASAQG
jgi:hypothetical protein